MARGSNGVESPVRRKREASYDPLSPKGRSERMKLIRGKNTEVYEQIRGSGWRYLVAWECELKNREAVAINIKSFLEG